MSAALEALARDKQLLIARSTLCRLQLHRHSLDLRRSLTWSNAATAVVAAPALRRIGFGLVASLAGLDRIARFIRLADRIVQIARLAGSVIACADKPRPPTAGGIEQP